MHIITVIFVPASSSAVKSGGDHTSFLELFNDVVVLISSAAPAMCKPVYMHRRGAILTRNGTIDLPITGEKVTFEKRPHNYYAKTGSPTSEIVVE